VSQPTKQQLQDFNDEQTIFSLALLMMDLRTAILLKDRAGIANAFLKSGVVVQNNPGFAERLKKIKDGVMASVNAPTTPMDVALSPPTVTTLTKEEEHA